MFTKVSGTSFTVVLIYVDDMIITSNDDNAIASLKDFFCTKFRIKDLGQMQHFLGVKVARSTYGISISQRKYTFDILNEVSLLWAKPLSTPMEEDIKLLPTKRRFIEEPITLQTVGWTAHLSHYHKTINHILGSHFKSIYAGTKETTS